MYMPLVFVKYTCINCGKIIDGSVIEIAYNPSKTVTGHGACECGTDERKISKIIVNGFFIKV